MPCPALIRAPSSPSGPSMADRAPPNTHHLQIMEAGPNPDFDARPLEDNLFEWHFTIRGPPGTAFEGGRYHGRICLPNEYPFKPPSIALLNASGRFEVGKKICLSVSAHHPEHWQPAWGLRTIITALIAFFPSKVCHACARSMHPDPRHQGCLPSPSPRALAPLPAPRREASGPLVPAVCPAEPRRTEP